MLNQTCILKTSPLDHGVKPFLYVFGFSFVNILLRIFIVYEEYWPEICFSFNVFFQDFCISYMIWGVFPPLFSERICINLCLSFLNAEKS